MKAFSLPILILLLSGCQPESTPTAYVDPVSGKTEEMLTTALPGWDTHQLKGAPESFISVSQSGKPIVSVMADGPGRDVTVHGISPADLFTLHGARNGAIEEIEFYSEGTLYRVQKKGSDWVLTSHRK
jgi:hypothetical protein